MITFSLDCELMWGLPDNVSSHYVKKNLAEADSSLRSIIKNWDQSGADLNVAFVIASLPSNSKEFPKKDLPVSYYKYSHETVDCSNRSNVKKGIHSFDHKYYSEMEQDEYEEEIRNIDSFIKNNPDYKEFFVFPKNQIFSSGVEEISERFDSLRVNSASWLYRSSSQGVGKIRRILRYADSFFPIYELFCNKKPEVECENAVVGTHFYRANLPFFLLELHVARLKFGMWFLKKMGVPVHIWSHPHNFGGNKNSISHFVKMGSNSE